MNTGLPPKNLAVFDGYTTDTYQYLYCPGSTVVNLQVSNAAIYVGYGKLTAPGGSPIFPDTDESFLPVLASIDQDCDAVRFKSYTPGVPAQLKLRAK